MSQAKNSVDSGTTTDRLASMAHETIGRAAPKARRVENEVRDAATKVADSAQLLHDHVVEAAEDRLRTARSYAEGNPFMVAGIAFAAGVLLTAWSRR